MVSPSVLAAGAVALWWWTTRSRELAEEQMSLADVDAARREEATATRCVTWNIAAVNNNPFEYWITHPSPEYNQLMHDVEEFLDTPGSRDVEVGAVFTEEMWAQLKRAMRDAGMSGVDKVEAIWRSDLRKRAIVAGILKDKSLGEKRLMSMPDRVTNTIDTARGVANRPTPISCSVGAMGSVDAWWRLWMRFMFDEALPITPKGGGEPAPKKPSAMLGKISRAKYPALSEAEEAISIPLQTLCLAIFDAILVHVVNGVSPGGGWENLKVEMIDSLYANKDERTVDILHTTYADADVIFLQEAATAFAAKISRSALGYKYAVVSPERPSKADQNSLILLRKSKFDTATVVDVTDAAMEKLGPVVPQ